MKKNTIWSLTVLFICILALSSCGGGGGGGGSSSTPASVSGIWNGTSVSDTTHQSTTITGIVTENGELRFISLDGVQYHGTVTVSDHTVSGTITGTTPIGTFFLDGSSTTTFTIIGTFDPHNSFTGTFSGGGDSGTFTLTYDASSDLPSSISLVQGRWEHDGNILGHLTLNINASGTITGENLAGCAYSGTISPINPVRNEYRVTIAVTGCGPLDGSFSGLAILSGTSVDGTLIVGVSGSSYSIAAEFSRDIEIR